MLILLEHASPKYGPRTAVNAKEADLTVAFAVDFGTFGEKLTHKVAGERYVGIPLLESPLDAARLLYRALRHFDAHVLNVAGNGIYTLAQHGWTQERANRYVHAVIAKVHEHWPLRAIRSGGQTGIDVAGLIAAVALDIPATGLLPNGFLQRGTDKVDRRMGDIAVRKQIEDGAAVLSAIAVAQPVVPNGSIRVVSKRQGGTRPEPDETVIDGDRKNPVLGNRHHLHDWKDAQARETVIRQHRAEDYEPDVLAGGPIYQQMQDLAQRVRDGESIALACWCKPLPCHLDHVAEGIWKLAQGIDLQAEIRANVAARNPVRPASRSTMSVG